MNTVVFSIRGKSYIIYRSEFPLMQDAGDRPLPSCLGGGDLDGDTYNLLPLKDLPEFKPSITRPPALYNPAPKKILERPSTMDDVAEFFMEYITSDVGLYFIHMLIRLN